ncbi:hypothetical protein [uncultured Tenacibaculum sp.]|uniref:hypothetical protein n=1 Tax=uncultured Tenacibaculum sp. TaxID=174713 RepID=UPI00261E1994|nr:hypothetical protein [uncultured Tenacibaculum sp.]
MDYNEDTYQEAIKYLKKRGITAYELHKYSGKSESGFRKILNGLVDSPRRSSKEIVINFYNSLIKKERKLKNVNSEYTKGLEKFTPHQIGTYISENLQLFNTEEIFLSLFKKSILIEANKIVEKGIEEEKNKSI